MELGKPYVTAFVIIKVPSSSEARDTAGDVIAEYYSALSE
jgi:hypothetical protein